MTRDFNDPLMSLIATALESSMPEEQSKKSSKQEPKTHQDSKQTKSNSTYHLLVVPEDCSYKQFNSIDQLTEEVRKIRESELKEPTNCKLFIIEGQRVFISKGEYKYLMLPDGKNIPIFTKMDELEKDDDGYIVTPFGNTNNNNPDSKLFDSDSYKGQPSAVMDELKVLDEMKND